MVSMRLSLRIRVILAIYILFDVVRCEFSGFYVDNGIGQTIMEESIPHTDAELLRHHILDLLDLPYRDDSERVPPTNRKSIPKFFYKLYQHLREKDDQVDEADDDDDYDDEQQSKWSSNSFQELDGITDEHARVIEESDMIMTFLNNNVNAVRDYHNETHLSFDLSEVSTHGTNLLLSDLHLFKRRMPEKKLGSNICRITIYAAIFSNGMKQLHPIHIENTTINYEGWIRLNFTAIFSGWIANKRPNNVLDITIQCQNAKHQMETPSIDANYIFSLWDTQHQPFITAYFKNDELYGHSFSSMHKHRRPKRSVNLLNPSGKSRNYRRESFPMNPLLHQPTHLRGCQRYILFVSFQELRWDDWIIAPSGYGAFYCAGACNFPFSHDVSATNHAIVQTLAHLLQSRDIPKPCCAPSKLQSISLLYSQWNDQFHIKRYRGMIAKSCACQ